MASNQEFVDVIADRAGVRWATDKDTGERTVRVQVEAGRRAAVDDSHDKQIRVLDLQGKCIAIGEKVDIVDEGEKIVLCLRVVETPEDSFQEEQTGPFTVKSDSRSNLTISFVKDPEIIEGKLRDAALFLFAEDPERPFKGDAANLRDAAVKWGLPAQKAEEILVYIWHATRPKIPLGVDGVAHPIDKNLASEYSGYKDHVTHEIVVTPQIYNAGDPGRYLVDGNSKKFLIKERLPNAKEPTLALKELLNDPHEVPQF